MGKLIMVDDIDTMKLTPEAREKLQEWARRDELLRHYIASIQAKALQDEPS